MKGIRLRVDKGLGRVWGVGSGCRFVRVDGLCFALGLETAFRRGLELGVGFKVQVKVNKSKSMRRIIVIGFMACTGLVVR